jgi:DNA-directed RNA polymerase subunit L
MSDIDDLLTEAKRVCGERWNKAPEYPWEVAARFGAEVERLRAELLVAKDASGKLFASYNAEHFLTEVGSLRTQVAKLEAENAILRGLDKKSDGVREVRDERWEAEHPKPE